MNKTKPQPARAENEASPRPSLDAFGEIVRLARAGSSRQRFMAQVLQCIVRHWSSPYGAIHIRYSSEVVQDEAHFGPDNPGFWKPSLQSFLTESLTEPRPRARVFKAKSGQAKVALLSAPMYDPSGPAIGAVALVVAIGHEDECSTRLASLESLCRVASFAAELVGGASAARSAKTEPDRGVAKSSMYESPEELAFAITNELRNRLDCEQVALGLVEGRHVRILSVSGLDQFNHRGPGATNLTAAMEECLDAGRPVAHPPSQNGGEDSGAVYHLHRQWHAQAKGDAVCSMPLKAGDSTAAILSIRYRADLSRTMPAPKDLMARVEPYAASLVLTRKASRTVTRHCYDSVRSGFATLTSPGHLGRKIAAALLAAAVGTFLFGSMNYRVTAPCRIGAATVHHLSAPFSGILKASHVRAGDRVLAGQLLVEFDTRELEQQLAEIEGQLAVLGHEHAKAMSDNMPALGQIALANQEISRVRRDIVLQKIEQAGLRSPVDGVVIQGDPRERIGAVLGQGDPLLQVAPHGSWKVEVDLPESAARDVAAGLSGAFVSFARPETQQPFQISRVLPSAEVRGMKNTIVAQADLSGTPDWLKVGMEGVARVEVGSRPIWWIALHRATDYLRVKFWL